MANGYVPRFMRPPPGQRLPYVQPFQNMGPQPNADPSSLFEHPKPAFCAFPDDGPNIFQQAFTSFKISLAQMLAATWTAALRLFEGVDSTNLRGDVLTEALRANSWSIFIGLACVVVMSLLAWFFAPKGENQTYAGFPTLQFSIKKIPPSPWPAPHEPTLNSKVAAAVQDRHRVLQSDKQADISTLIGSGGVH